LQTEQVVDELQVRQPWIEQLVERHWVALVLGAKPVLQMEQLLGEPHVMQLAIEQPWQMLPTSRSPLSQVWHVTEELQTEQLAILHMT
jgi:hypothetical protein